MSCPKYAVGFDPRLGLVAVIDTRSDRAFCLVDPEHLFGGVDQAKARAQDLADLLNKETR